MEDHIIKCPACTAGILQVTSDQLEVPYFGEVMISTLVCTRCGYRSSDIVPLEKKEPKRYILEVDTSEKLSCRIVRSGTSVVQIPEIGARIDPGLFSEGFVTNVEGLLQRFQNILFQLLKDLTTTMDISDVDVKIERTRKLIERLGNLIDGQISKNDALTVVIEDPYGNSAIISDDQDAVVEEHLTDDEISEMLSERSGKNVITEL
jgi:zinc finger protein